MIFCPSCSFLFCLLIRLSNTPNVWLFELFRFFCWFSISVSMLVINLLFVFVRVEWNSDDTKTTIDEPTSRTVPNALRIHSDPPTVKHQLKIACATLLWIGLRSVFNAAQYRSVWQVVVVVDDVVPMTFPIRIRTAHALSFRCSLSPSIVNRPTRSMLISFCLPSVRFWRFVSSHSPILVRSFSPNYALTVCDAYKVSLNSLYDKRKSACFLSMFFVSRDHVGESLKFFIARGIAKKQQQHRRNTHVYSVSVAKIKWKIVCCYECHVQRHTHKFPNTKWIVTISNCRTVVRCCI